MRAIIEAAATVFAEHGFRAARVADIAVRAGIGKGTVYEYFRSKEELFLAVFDSFAVGTLEETLARLEPRPASSIAVLERFADATLGACQKVLYLYPLTMEFWSAAATPEFKDSLMGEFRKLYAGYREVLAGVIRDGMAAGEIRPDVDAHHVAAALVGTIDALFLQAWFDPGFDAEAAGRHFVAVVLRGIAATDASDPASTTER